VNVIIFKNEMLSKELKGLGVDESKSEEWYPLFE